MPPHQKHLNEHIMRFALTLGAQLEQLRACVVAGGDQAALLGCIRLVEHELRNELTAILMTIYDESEAHQ